MECERLRALDGPKGLNSSHIYSQAKHDQDPWTDEEKADLAAPLRVDIQNGANIEAPVPMSDRDAVQAAGIAAAQADALAAVTPGTDRHGRIHT